MNISLRQLLSSETLPRNATVTMDALLDEVAVTSHATDLALNWPVAFDEPVAAREAQWIVQQVWGGDAP